MLHLKACRQQLRLSGACSEYRLQRQKALKAPHTKAMKAHWIQNSSAWRRIQQAIQTVECGLTVTRTPGSSGQPGEARISGLSRWVRPRKARASLRKKGTSRTPSRGVARAALASLAEPEGQALVQQEARHSTVAAPAMVRAFHEGGFNDRAPPLFHSCCSACAACMAQHVTQAHAQVQRGMQHNSHSAFQSQPCTSRIAPPNTPLRCKHHAHRPTSHTCRQRQGLAAGS